MKRFHNCCEDDEVTKRNDGNDQGPNHMQIGVMGGDDKSESSDESYTIDFSSYQTMMNQSDNTNNETDKKNCFLVISSFSLNTYLYAWHMDIC